jgi:hypothetical protein
MEGRRVGVRINGDYDDLWRKRSKVTANVETGTWIAGFQAIEVSDAEMRYGW